MSLGNIAIRCLFTYLFLLILLRVSGKRTIAQGSVHDFLTALILGDLIDDMLWGEASAAKFVVAAGTLLLSHLLVSIVAFHSPGFYLLVNGPRVEIVRDGALVREGMGKERLDELEVMTLVRNQGVDDMREIAVGSVEEDGTLSLIKRPWAREAQRQDRDRVKEVLP
jgi:uncharacterized membrane protein YcaP (DUF421 family)